MKMNTLAVLVCLIVGSLGWEDPDWSNEGTNRLYPPLPGSVLVKSYPRNDKPVLMKSLFKQIELTTALTSFPYDISTTPAGTTPESTTPAGTTPKSTTITYAPSTTPPEETCSSFFSCADCYTTQVCRPKGGVLVPVVQIKCPKKAPFCDSSSGTCSTSPDYTKCGAPDQFICLENGYFPDPLNCSVYHVCNDYTSQEFFCLEGNVYDPDEMRCVSPGEYSCNAVDCSKLPNTNTGIKQIIGNTHYFSYCNNNQPLIVDRCPNQYKLNITSQVCEPICERDGLMRDLVNCNHFYQCSTYYLNASTPVTVRTNLPCPANEAFDESAFQCIPKASTNCTM